MKNMIDICKDFGIEIPADKHAEFNKAVAENYKTIAEFEKKVNRLTDDLSAATKRAETAEETLKGFEGKDFEAITKERDEWQRKHKELEESRKRDAEDREFNEVLTAAIKEAKGKNAKAIMALLELDELRGSRNQEKDIKAALDSLRTESGYLFDDNGGTPYFAKDKGNPNVGGQITKKDIMSIKDDNERYRMIDQNRHLFIKKG